MLNEYTKPRVMYTSAESCESPSGLRSEVSRFAGWVTIDEKKGMFRKNAPETEIGKQKLTEQAKRKNRPEWMTQVNPSLIKRVPGNSYRNFDLPMARSLYDVDTYRHNFDTQTQFDTERVDHLKPTSLISPRAAGMAKYKRDHVTPTASSFTKWDERLFTSPRNSNPCGEVNVKPYSFHNTKV